ncbi:uncharacterized protein LOC121858532 isoform X3 [Homarus americanus]|uniref:uncharacterized protein LOC121858532 isoform X3 n=1 Tax=Homarus americanus TaxID=6706 RepID=UPI001C43CE71|nr:uncharacterized protein LOC121858532 isoform X3 [Homarus americanus]XP_042210947.1 uncharacterized protein LOC121858532 isoform X3 [Homarus americanus]XP_042210948.1 uncharacterized protein LOC121858532 isoform X3 [Homarus americanus]
MRALIKHNPKMDHLKGDADQLATEAQLAALQEQLVAVMLENQHLAEEVKVLRESSATEQLRQQLDREKEKSRILMERLQEKEAKERERGDREARERERHTREKSLPAGDKSPSLPQRIRKRINQIHKPQSFEVEDGSPGPPQPPISEKTRLLGEERTNPRPGPEPPACQIVKYGGEAANHKSSSTFDVVESPSRGRFAWKRRGLEKSKSLDQSEFLASLNGAASTTSITVGGAVAGGGEGGGIGGGGGGGGGGGTSSWMDDDQRRDSDSDDGERCALGDTGVLGSETESGTNPAGAFPGSLLGTTVVSPKYPWWRRLEVQVVAAIGELVKDFSEVAEEELPDGDPEGDPLTVKKLKENILRFGCVMRPLTELSAAVTSLLRWESPSATLLALVIYLYSVIFGWVLPLVLLMAIVKLSINYLKKRGWTQNVFRRLRREGHEPLDTTTSEAGLGDKFALVLQVARRVQNQLGAVSNAAEKLKNLLMWEHEAARRLYFFLWVVLLASVLLPAAQLFTLIGVYLGLKFFVMDYVFFRYPRIRLKYDSTSRLWDTLPTDADLERRGDKNRGENGNSSPDLTSFLELFSLPATEAPLPGWQSGRRCTLVNRDRSLTSAFKNGRLYLTNRLAKQDKQMASSTKLTAPTNKVTSSNKLTVSNSSKGNQSAKLSASFTSKQNIDGVRKGSLTGFSKTQSDSASLTSGFSFLSKGNKTLKARELKEYKEDDVEMLEKIFEDTGDEDSITTSRIFQTCDSARSSPQSSRSRDSSFQVWRSLSDTDAAARDSRPPSSFGKRKGLLLRSVSEQSELHPDFIDDDDTNEDNLSSYDVKITRDNKDQTEQDGEKVKPKKSRLARLKTTNTDEHKTKTSVIDKLNEKVFYAV